MGKRAASGSAAKRGRDGAAKDDEKTKHPRGVPLWKLFVKSPLRSWPDENGCMLLTERKSPAAYFTGAKVKEIASSATSLCVSKPAMGVSLTAASLEACAAAMAVMPRTAEKAYARTGIPAARSCLEPLEKAIGASNLNNKAYEDKKAAAKHVEKLLTTLGAKEGHAARMKSFAQLADAGSRLYAGGMAALEMGALARDPRSWAKKVSDKKNQDVPLQRFLKTHDLHDLAVGVAQVNASVLEAKAPGKKRPFGASSDAASGTSGGSGHSKGQSLSQERSSVSSLGSGEELSVETRKKPKHRPPAPAAEEAPSRRAEKKAKKAPKEKKQQKEARAPSLPAEGPSKDDDLRREPLDLTLDDQEEEEDLEQADGEDAEIAAFRTWGVAEIDTFATEVANMTAQMDVKKDRFSLSALVAVLDGVPDAVLTPAGLLDARETMKKMSRLPKRAKLVNILELMQALAGKAQSMREELQACQETLAEQDQRVEDPIYEETSDE